MQAYGEGFDIMKNATSTELPEGIVTTWISARSRNYGAAAAWSARGCSISAPSRLPKIPVLERYTGFRAGLGAKGAGPSRRRSKKRCRRKY